MTTDRVPAYPGVLDELLPGACHVMERYANNLIESDPGIPCTTAQWRPSTQLSPTEINPPIIPATDDLTTLTTPALAQARGDRTAVRRGRSAISELR